MSPQPHHDALALVESAYDLDGSDDVHMRRLLATAAPSLDHGLGLVGVRFRVVKERAELLSGPAVWGNVPPKYERVFAEALDQLTAHDVRSSWGHPVALDTQSDALERAFPDGVPTDMPWLDASVTGGVSDNLVAKMVDVTGVGCLICAPLGTARSVDAHDEARWRRLMTHVVAGWRLRRELGEAAGEEAVLEPDGRVVHASGPARSVTARSVLREAAVAVDRARTRRGRQDVEAARGAGETDTRGRERRTRWPRSEPDQTAPRAPLGDVSMRGANALRSARDVGVLVVGIEPGGIPGGRSRTPRTAPQRGMGLGPRVRRVRRPHAPRLQRQRMGQDEHLFPRHPHDRRAGRSLTHHAG